MKNLSHKFWVWVAHKIEYHTFYYDSVETQDVTHVSENIEVQDDGHITYGFK